MIEIIPFSVEHSAAFRDLNLEWVSTLFRVEPHDEEQLSHPERILEDGGEIWLAQRDGEIVGTGVLFCEGEDSYEIAKMAVRPDMRGQGIGRQILTNLIRRFREREGERLWLQTNSRLKNAIALYRQAGFVDFTPSEPSPYERADVFLEWRGNSG
ncbi:MAG TPA: GNAT family N-acetyltransferase [Gammaproteobacteria bacterium]|nr:GNAT family N-acetyltransferase [Gammaproteobacteria bacterium]